MNNKQFFGLLISQFTKKELSVSYLAAMAEVVERTDLVNEE